MMRFRKLFLTPILLLAALSGCAKRSIVVQGDTTGVLTQQLKGVHVAFPDKDKNPVDTIVDLPAGTLVKTAKTDGGAK